MLHGEWLEQLYNLRTHGTKLAPRGQATFELLDQKLALMDMRQNILDAPARKLNLRYLVAEWVWMSFGLSDVQTLARYNSVMRQFSDDGIFLTGAYGPHICAQRPRVIQKLKEDPNTRQAVIEIPRPRDWNTKDMPCTLSFQFLLRNGQLNLITTMRSSDAWLGIPYDVFTFTMIAIAMAGELNVRPGWFVLNMGSSHLYERDLEAVNLVRGDILNANTLSSPDLPSWPPYWLEWVLEKQDRSLIPVNADPVWQRYADVLLSKNSAEARNILACVDYPVTSPDRGVAMR